MKKNDNNNLLINDFEKFININDTNGTPIYYKIYEYYKNKIIKGELLEGEALPPERILSTIFNVSRSTIRQALKKLEEDNFIYKLKGSGTFVSHKTLKQELSSFYSFYEEIIKAGKTPSSKVLDFKIIPINKQLSEIFKITNNTEILLIKRLRLVDNEPLMYEETFIPTNRFENFNVDLLNSTPMYTIFKNKYNVIFEKATESFSSLILDDKNILNFLGYKKSASCMLIKRLTYEMGEVIEYTISYARGDKYEYKVTLNNI